MDLKSALEALKHTPVSVQDLKKLVPPKCDVVKLQQLKGRDRRSIFKNKRAVIVLLPSKISKIGHYICLVPKRHHIEYFSSLGNSPQKESKLLHNDEGITIIMKILGSDFIYNRTKLQSGDFKITTCAMWVCARAWLSDLRLREFLPMLNRVSAKTPDDIVSIMNFLHFQDV